MKLIIFDKDKTVSYFGESKLQFIKTKIEKCLKFALIDKDHEETLTSSFDHIYIRRSNFLCCLADEESNHAFIAVFPNQEKCEQIYNAIVKATSAQQELGQIVNEDAMFKDIFFIPLIKEIHAGINGHTHLKTIILDFIYSLDADEQLAFLKLLAETLLIPLPKISNDVNEEDMDSTINTDIASTSGTTFDSSADSGLNQSSNSNTRKRSFDNISNKESGKTKKVSSRKSTSFDEPSPKNSSDDVIYDIVECLLNENLVKKFLVFTSPERTQCYEYLKRSRYVHNYRCIKCSAQDKCTVLKSTIHNNGSRTFDLNMGQHVCEPIDYLPSNYQSSLIIKSPNFMFTQRKRNGIDMPLLIVYDSADQNLRYKFGYDSLHNFFACSQCKHRGKVLTARYIQHNGENAIELGKTQHICEPQRYIPSDL